MIVLILVAVLWIAVLVPSVISKLSERRSAGSIDNFHERLDLLERTGPKLVAPAYRLTGTESAAGPTGPVLVAAVRPPTVRPNLILLPPAEAAPGPSETLFEDPSQPPESDEVVVRLHSWAAEEDESNFSALSTEERQLVAADQRRLARKRRRDVFGVLCALAALSGLLGLVHPLRAAWIASAVFLALLLVFVGLAMYGQRVEAERRHMQQLRRADQARIVDDEFESGAVKYLSEEDLAHYYEAEDARLAAEA